MKPIIQYHENGIFFMFNLDRIRLLNNKFRGLSPSGGVASLLFDQGVPIKLLTTGCPGANIYVLTYSDTWRYTS